MVRIEMILEHAMLIETVRTATAASTAWLHLPSRVDATTDQTHTCRDVVTLTTRHGHETTHGHCTAGRQCPKIHATQKWPHRPVSRLLLRPNLQTALHRQAAPSPPLPSPPPRLPCAALAQSSAAYPRLQMNLHGSATPVPPAHMCPFPNKQHAVANDAPLH